MVMTKFIKTKRRMKDMPKFKIIMTDGDGEVLVEVTKQARGWSNAVLYSSKLEYAMDDLDGDGTGEDKGVNKLTITAERVQTDVTPPDPVIPATDDPEDDEEDDEEEPGDLADGTKSVGWNSPPANDESTLEGSCQRQES